VPLPSSLGSSTQPSATAPTLAAMMQSVVPTAFGDLQHLATAPNSPFLLRHHPKNWEAESEGLEETTWLPVIDILVSAPGAHLQRTLKKGEGPTEAFRGAINADAAQGWRYLEPSLVIEGDLLPTGVPAGTYIRAVPAKDPRTGVTGTRYLEAWNVPMTATPGTPQRFRFDRASYNRWRLHLVESGQVEPPSADVIAATKEARAGRYYKIAAKALPTDLREVQLAREKAITDAMDAAVTPGSDVTPEPATPLFAQPKRKAKAEPKAKADGEGASS